MIATLTFIFLLFFNFASTNALPVVAVSDTIPSRNTVMFRMSQPASGCDLPAPKLLQTALTGYEILVKDSVISNTGVITIIDYSMQSDKERLWVIDLNQRTVLFHCLVSHGRNSGELFAEDCSNAPGSYKSSPGFYVTGETYIGRHGLSLKLDGLERGINDNARERDIVIHGAEYVSDDFIRCHGRLGRSQGCPAVPVDLSKEIISTIKDGTCLFIYAPEAGYTSASPIIRRINSVLGT